MKNPGFILLALLVVCWAGAWLYATYTTAEFKPPNRNFIWNTTEFASTNPIVIRKIRLRENRTDGSFTAYEVFPVYDSADLIECETGMTPRLCEFEVSGIFELPMRLQVNSPITVAPR